MTAAQKKAVTAHRRRLRRRGFTRVEVQIHKQDADLVRGIARALADPQREAETRASLRKQFGDDGSSGLKALLAAAPLEGIDLTRDRDIARDVDL